MFIVNGVSGSSLHCINFGAATEPSCGIGNFIGMLPPEMQQAKMYGVEIDTISAAIAQQLYQRTSIAAQPFEEANIPDSFFDALWAMCLLATLVLQIRDTTSTTS